MARSDDIEHAVAALERVFDELALMIAGSTDLHAIVGLRSIAERIATVIAELGVAGGGPDFEM